MKWNTLSTKNNLKKYIFIAFLSISIADLVAQNAILDYTRPIDSTQHEMTQVVGSTAFDAGTTPTQRNNRWYAEDKITQFAYSSDTRLDHILAKTNYHVEPLTETGIILDDLTGIRNHINGLNDTMNYPTSDAVAFYPLQTNQSGKAGGTWPNGRRFMVINGTLAANGTKAYVRTHEHGHTNNAHHYHGLPSTSGTGTPTYLNLIETDTTNGMSQTTQEASIMSVNSGSGDKRFFTTPTQYNAYLAANGGTDTAVYYKYGFVKHELPAHQLDNPYGNTTEAIWNTLYNTNPEFLHTEPAKLNTTPVAHLNQPLAGLYLLNPDSFNTSYINVIGTNLGTDERYSLVIVNKLNPDTAIATYSLNDTIYLSSLPQPLPDSLQVGVYAYYANSVAYGETFSSTIDNIPPTATISSTETGPTNSTSIPVSISVSEATTNLTASDFVLNNCSIANFAGSGSSYSFNLIPNGDGLVSATLPTGSFSDAAGNLNNSSSSFSIEYDGTAPVVSLSSSADSLNNLSQIPVAVTISESIQNTLNSANFSATNANISNFSGSGSNYNFSLVPNGDGPVSVSNNIGIASDFANNPNTNSANLQFFSDQTPPTFSPASDTVHAYLDPNGLVALDPSHLGSATDNGSGLASVEVNPNNFDCNDVDDIQNTTVTVTDSAGNSANYNQAVEVADTSAPINNTPDHFTLTLQPNQASVSLSNDLITGNDNCNIVAKSWSQNEFTAPGVYTITSTVTDGSGNSTTKESTITVEKNVGIEEQEFKGLKIYPNPTKGILYIEVQEKLEQIQLIDLNGKIVKDFNAESRKLDISTIAKGIYFIKLNNATKQSIQKVVIE